MEIIPVIDLLHGKAVHARRGERDRYLPVHSALCASSDPLELAHAYIELYPFRTLYIADLDAIQGTGDNNEVVRILHARFPDITLWLDAGIQRPEQLKAQQNAGVRSIIGSERLDGMQHFLQLVPVSPPAPILSLDFTASGLLGPAALLHRPASWPTEVICMSMAKVGSNEGPDIEHIAGIVKKAGSRHVYAAGGVRDATDILRLQEIGVAGVLIASVLHDRQIEREQLAALQKQKTQG